MAWTLKRRQIDPAAVAAAEERRHRERAVREAERQQAVARRRQVAGELAATALSWGMAAWLEGAMWACLAGGLAVDYIGSYADLAATFGAFGYADPVRWIMPLGIDLPVTASVLGQLLAGRWKCGWWVRVRLGILTAVTAPLTLVGNALRGAIDANGHFATGFHVALWMDLAAFAVPGLGVVLIGWVASMMQGERAELTRRRLEAEAIAPRAGVLASGADDVAEPVREPAPELPAGTAEPPPDDKPRGRRSAPKPASKPVRGRAREQAPRLSGQAVKAMVAAAREHVLADSERDPGKALDEAIVAHLAGGGCRSCGARALSRSRVRTYLAERRHDEAAPADPDPARRPRVVHLEAAPAAASAHAQEA